MKINFNPAIELANIKAYKQIIRKKRYSRSKLDRYSDELRALKLAGARITDIQLWLKKRRLNVCWSTIQRWFAKNG